MSDAYLLAGMVAALGLIATFMVWDTHQLLARINRDHQRLRRRPTPVEREANLLWQTHRDREFRVAMTLTMLRNEDRLRALVDEELAVAAAQVRERRGLLNPGKPCAGEASLVCEPVPPERSQPPSRAFPGLSSRSPA